MFGKRPLEEPTLGIKQKLLENDPGWVILIQIWFAMTWRYLLWLIPFLIGAIILAVAVALCLSLLMGMGKDAGKQIAETIGFIFGVAAGVLACMKSIKGILGLKFSGHQLVLLTPSVVAETEKSDI